MFAVKVNGALKKACTLEKTKTEVFTFAQTILSYLFEMLWDLSIQIEYMYHEIEDGRFF